MTLQQVAENFFCAYFFGALSSTEDLPLDFESKDVQMNSQRTKTVATTNCQSIRQGELLIRFLAFQIKRRMGECRADAADAIVFLLQLLPTNPPSKDLHFFRLLQIESRHVVACCPIGWLSMRYKTGIVLWTTGLSLTCC